MFLNFNRWLSACWLLGGVTLLLAGFVAPPAVTLTWRTASEHNSAGFNVYRTHVATAEIVQINNALIASRGSSGSGARYRLRDTEARRGQTYTYTLEEVGLNGRAIPHPAFQQTHRVPQLSSEVWVGAVILLSGLVFYGRFGKSRAEGGEHHAVPAKTKRRQR